MSFKSVYPNKMHACGHDVHTAILLGTGLVEFTEGYKFLINNDEIVGILEAKAIELLGKDCVYIAKEPSLGAEDFSFYLDEAKGAFYNLGRGNSNMDIQYKGHHPMFLVNEDCIKTGILIQTENAIALLNDRSLQHNTKNEEKNNGV